MARIIPAFAQFFDGEGNPLVEGFLKFTVSGTNATDKDTFADVNETVKNLNPLPLDAEGRCPSAFGSGAYRATLYDGDMQQIDQFDPVSDTAGQVTFVAWESTAAYNISEVVVGDDLLLYRSLKNVNQSNVPAVDSEYWELVDFERAYNVNVTYQIGDRCIDSMGNTYRSLTADNLGNTPVSSPTNWVLLSQLTSIYADSGAADAYVLSAVNALAKPGAYYRGLQATFLPSNANTGASTVNIEELGVKKILTVADAAVAADDIVTSNYCELIYDSALDSGAGAFALRKLVVPNKDGVLIVQDQKAAGTDGGTATATTWTTRTLNTVVRNTIAGASLASNQITLPAGEYVVRATAPFYSVAYVQIRLRDTTNSLFYYGGSSFAGVGGDYTHAPLTTSFVLTGATILDLQYYCSTTSGTDDLGRDYSFSGSSAVYSEVEIQRLL